jgi:hypothetical protein
MITNEMFMNKAMGVAAALAFVLAVALGTAAAATDITGAWLVTLDLPQSKPTIAANLKQNGDKLSAEVVTPAGTLDFNGTLVDNKISAVYSMQLQGNFLEIRMNGVVDADTLSGTIEFGSGQPVKWTAVRKPVTSAPGTEETPPAAPAEDPTPTPNEPADAPVSAPTK